MVVIVLTITFILVQFHCRLLRVWRVGLGSLPAYSEHVRCCAATRDVYAAC